MRHLITPRAGELRHSIRSSLRNLADEPAAFNVRFAPLTRMLWLVVSLVIGCGDHTAALPDAPATDALPDTMVYQPTTITVNTVSPPALIAFREASDAWQTPTATTASTFELTVRAPYSVVVVCDDHVGPITVSEFIRTPDEDHAITASCATPAAATALVTGHVAQAAQLALATNGTAVSDIDNWDFSLMVAPGTYDLIAHSAARVVVRRSIAVTQASNAIAPPIDLFSDGVALTTTPLTVTNVSPAENVGATVVLDTGTTDASIFIGALSDVVAIPDSLLVPSDAQRVSVSADDGHTFKTLRRNFRAGTSTSFTLPPLFGSITFSVSSGMLAVAWTEAPAHDALVLRVDDFEGPRLLSQSLEVGKTVDASSAILDTDIPGFLPAWTVDFTKPYGRTLTATQSTANESTESGLSESIPAR